MKASKNWAPAVLAVLTIFLFSWHPWSRFCTSASAVDALDSTAVELVDAYGFDRLETTEGEQWLPAVQVSASAGVEVAVHPLDTVPWRTWQDYTSRMLYAPAGSPVLPFAPGQEIQLWRAESSIFPAFFHQLQGWTPFREQTWSGQWPRWQPDCKSTAGTVVLLDEKVVAELSRQQRLRELPIVLSEQVALLLYFGSSEPTALWALGLPVLWLPAADETSEAIAAQALFGAMDIPLSDGQLLVASRLGYAPPEAVGIDRQALRRMDRYVSQAIRRKAMPGCQVLVAKNGKIVLEKSYGYHTYRKDQPVENEDLYDLASITKAAATTLGLMRLHEHGQLRLEDRLRELLPDYRKTSLRYLRLRHLLAHHTGLQANLPIARWLRADDSFQVLASTEYPHALDQDFYLKAGIREDVLAELKRVRIPRRLHYRYSDVNFLLLQQVLETSSGQELDAYLRNFFYEPMGLQRLTFRPGLSLPAEEIVPTAYDKRWRKRLVHGEVHDESAALLGGVAGHAGLFSNARDLAAVFQMLLNEGTYGGHTYFEPATVESFTARNGYNNRAFGFDRLAAHSRSLRYYGASLQTFGHTGFTGTCVWADPEEDLLFIFLSNRTYPQKYNTKLQQLGLRERLHRIVYQSLNTAGQGV
jgi:CubicO group peptidase (beta-lactamase class C family)